uniref:Uncharacterized protein n=1 Tax=Anguilla anguilla TaxID=7936 RepID=A0A0E9QZT9_ANGAN
MHPAEGATESLARGFKWIFYYDGFDLRCLLCP